jgi:hypothetical protein
LKREAAMSTRPAAMAAMSATMFAPPAAMSTRPAAMSAMSAMSTRPAAMSARPAAMSTRPAAMFALPAATFTRLAAMFTPRRVAETGCDSTWGKTWRAGTARGSAGNLWRAVSAVPLIAVALSGTACGLGEGEGEITSDKLAVVGCWNGQFDLRPDFFAASPYRRMLAIRVQHGGDVQEVSDGVTILVDDIDRVRAHIAEHPGEPLRVGLQPNVVPPGVPVVSDPDPPIVHLTLYLHRACHAQNSALYSIAGGIVFRSIFNGDLNEDRDSELLTDAYFDDITVGDPRDRQPGSDEIAHTSHLRGRFKFYFRRGQPAQPFP